MRMRPRERRRCSRAEYLGASSAGMGMGSMVIRNSGFRGGVAARVKYVEESMSERRNESGCPRLASKGRTRTWGTQHAHLEKLIFEIQADEFADLAALI